MRTKIALIIAATAAFAAVPAQANDARFEVRGGILFDGSDSEGTAGLAMGLDFDLGDTLFVGVEGSMDKVLSGGNEPSFGASGRFGADLNESVRLYATGGYHTRPCDSCVSSYSGGAGAQYALTEDAYIKLEYRHFFVNDFSDYNAVLVGIGIAAL